jgi:hypothetical protein
MDTTPTQAKTALHRTFPLEQLCEEMRRNLGRGTRLAKLARWPDHDATWPIWPVSALRGCCQRLATGVRRLLLPTALFSNMSLGLCLVVVKHSRLLGNGAVVKERRMPWCGRTITEAAAKPWRAPDDPCRHRLISPWTIDLGSAMAHRFSKVFCCGISYWH